MQLGWTRLGYGHYIGLTRRCAVKWVDGSIYLLARVDGSVCEIELC